MTSAVSNYALPYKEIFLGEESDLAVNRNRDSQIVKISKGALGIVSAIFLILEQLGEGAVCLTAKIQESVEDTILDWPLTILSVLLLLIPGMLAIGIARGVRLLLELIGVMVGESAAKALEKLREKLSVTGQLLKQTGIGTQLVGKLLQDDIDLLDLEEPGMDGSKTITACRNCLGTIITKIFGEVTEAAGDSLVAVGRVLQRLGTDEETEEESETDSSVDENSAEHYQDRQLVEVGKMDPMAFSRKYREPI